MEHMLRYQLHYGLKPVGSHRHAADALLHDVCAACSFCDGAGVRGSDDMSTWSPCVACRGWGALPFPNAPALKQVRAEVARQFPDATVRGADDVTADDFLRVLRRAGVIVQDLAIGEVFVCQ